MSGIIPYHETFLILKKFILISENFLRFCTESSSDLFTWQSTWNIFIILSMNLLVDKNYCAQEYICQTTVAYYESFYLNVLILNLWGGYLCIPYNKMNSHITILLKYLKTVDYVLKSFNFYFSFKCCHILFVTPP